MPFPATRKLMQDAGYSFAGHKICPCGARMELWHTPSDQLMPMNLMENDESKAESHFATCPKAQQFRRKK
jgi:hypothetical protein